MSKSKRENNHRRAEARYTDGPRRTANTHQQKTEKRVKNLFRSNNVEELLEADLNR